MPYPSAPVDLVSAPSPAWPLSRTCFNLLRPLAVTQACLQALQIRTSLEATRSPLVRLLYICLAPLHATLHHSPFVPLALPCPRSHLVLGCLPGPHTLSSPRALTPVFIAHLVRCRLACLWSLVAHSPGPLTCSSTALSDVLVDRPLSSARRPPSLFSSSTALSLLFVDCPLSSARRLPPVVAVICPPRSPTPVNRASRLSSDQRPAHAHCTVTLIFPLPALELCLLPSTTRHPERLSTARSGRRQLLAFDFGSLPRGVLSCGSLYMYRNVVVP